MNTDNPEQPRMPEMPEPDGEVSIFIAGRRVDVGAYRASTMREYALEYGRACVADAMAAPEFKVGDRIVWTSDYGDEFHGVVTEVSDAISADLDNRVAKIEKFSSRYFRHEQALQALSENAPAVAVEVTKSKHPLDPPDGMTWDAFWGLYRSENPGAFEQADELATLRKQLAEAQKEITEIASRIPCPHYMDPPDGVSVTVAEQVERTAKDAARYRTVRDSTGPDCDEFDAAIDAAMLTKGEGE